MSLKALASKVLGRDTLGTNAGTPCNELSQSQISVGQTNGTVVYLTPEMFEAYEERAAIIEYDAGLSRQEAEAAALSDFMEKNDEQET